MAGSGEALGAVFMASWHCLPGGIPLFLGLVRAWVLLVYPHRGGDPFHTRHFRVEADYQLPLPATEEGAFFTSMALVSRPSGFQFLGHFSLSSCILMRGKDSHDLQDVKGEPGFSKTGKEIIPPGIPVPSNGRFWKRFPGVLPPKGGRTSPGPGGSLLL